MAQRSYRTFGIVGLAFVLAVVAAVGLLILRGAQSEGVTLALVVTARIAFVFFWPCYVAGALAYLFGPAFLPLRRMARDLGLAFAAVEAVHIALVVRLCTIGDAPSLATFELFGTAAVFLLIITCLSFDFARRHLSEPVIRGIRWFGMNLIAYAFYVDFWRDPFSGTPKHMLEYLPFAVLSVAGPALRLLAWAKYMDRALRHSPYRMG
jgi:hypothetical protein